MKATHSVKVNGIWYAAGCEIPAVVVDATKDTTVENVADTTQEPVVEEKRYTKSRIRLMNAADVKRLAASKGIENADSYSANALKEMLIRDM